MGPAYLFIGLLQAALAGPLAIETSPHDDALVDQLVAACNAALEAERCYPLARAPADTQWFVVVSEQAPSRLRAQIEIHRATLDGALAHQREVDFSAADDLEQRHTAIGLIIAAYAVSQSEQVAPPPEPEPAIAPKPSPPIEISAPPEPIVIRKPKTWSLDLGVLAGPGLDRGNPRWGVLARGSFRPFKAPLAAVVGLRVAQRFASPSVRWLSADLGLALQLNSLAGPLGAELRAGLVVQNVHASAERESDQRSESGDALRAGGQTSGEVQLWLSDGFASFFGGGIELFRTRVDLDVGGDRAGVDRRWGGFGSIGLRFAR